MQSTIFPDHQENVLLKGYRDENTNFCPEGAHSPGKTVKLFKQRGHWAEVALMPVTACVSKPKPKPIHASS